MRKPLGEILQLAFCDLQRKDVRHCLLKFLVPYLFFPSIQPIKSKFLQPWEHLLVHLCNIAAVKKFMSNSHNRWRMFDQQEI